ncbi:MAG: hypothetical protein WDO24_30430 [Pseudomonadota bacterium]
MKRPKGRSHAISIRGAGTGERIIALPPVRDASEPQIEIALPTWLLALDDAWLVVPLKHPDRLLGFLVLRKPRAPRSLNWEDWDLLRTVDAKRPAILRNRQPSSPLLTRASSRRSTAGLPLWCMI